MLYAMLHFSIFVALVGLFESSVAFHSFVGGRVVFHGHLTPQTQIHSNSTLLNGIKRFLLTCQLWKNNASGATSTNDSGSGPAYRNIYVCWEDSEEDWLKTCENVTQEGKHCYITDFLKEFLRVKV